MDVFKLKLNTALLSLCSYNDIKGPFLFIKFIKDTQLLCSKTKYRRNVHKTEE